MNNYTFDSGASTSLSRIWFPNCGSSRIFAFPFAGGGTLWCRNWGMCAALLPGREARIGETPIGNMQDAVAALKDAIVPLLDRPYAFFGHSMGAGIAFELARLLIEGGYRAPSALMVSASLAPSRRTPIPEQDDAELIRRLQHMGGLPAGAVQSADWMQYAFPALRADMRLYTSYAAAPRPPLDVPLFAYCGDADANVSVADTEYWREETTGPFRLRVFSGGHFYFQPDAKKLLSSVSEDAGAFGLL